MDLLRLKGSNRVVFTFEGIQDCPQLQLLVQVGMGKGERRAFQRELRSRGVWSGQTVARASVTLEKLEGISDQLRAQAARAQTVAATGSVYDVRLAVSSSVEALAAAARIEERLRPNPIPEIGELPVLTDAQVNFVEID
jgi:hypothetical protein